MESKHKVAFHGRRRAVAGSVVIPALTPPSSGKPSWGVPARALICDRYREDRHLGRGGAGKVVQGWDTLDHRTVAVKELFPTHVSQSDDPGDEAEEDGAKEHKGARRGKGKKRPEPLPEESLTDAWLSTFFDHRNLVHSFESSYDCNRDKASALEGSRLETEDDGIIRVVLPLARGSLRSLLATRWSKEQMISIMYEMSCGLHYIHMNHFAHGDFNTANVLLFDSQDAAPTVTKPAETYKGKTHRKTGSTIDGKLVAKIADFGSAMPLIAEVSHPVLQMSPLYTSPELLCQRKRANEEIVALAQPADVWGFGLALVELLTGEPLSQIDSSHCPVAPSIEWLAPTICLIGEPPKPWLKKYGLNCSQELKSRHTRTESLLKQLKSTTPRAPLVFDPLHPCWVSALHILGEKSFVDALKLIQWCLQWDPKKRPTSEQLVTAVPLYDHHTCEVSYALQAPALTYAIPDLPADLRVSTFTLKVASRILDNFYGSFPRRPPRSPALEHAALSLAAKLFYDPMANLLYQKSKWRSSFGTEERRILTRLKFRVT